MATESSEQREFESPCSAGPSIEQGLRPPIAQLRGLVGQAPSSIRHRFPSRRGVVASLTASAPPSASVPWPRGRACAAVLRDPTSGHRSVPLPHAPLKALVWFWIIDETLVLTSMLSVCRLNEVGTCQVMEQVMIMVMMVMTTR